MGWPTLAAGCEESFRPLDPIDLEFSIYGYLDVSAETQWIRVMPIPMGFEEACDYTWAHHNPSRMGKAQRAHRGPRRLKRNRYQPLTRA